MITRMTRSRSRQATRAPGKPDTRVQLPTPVTLSLKDSLTHSIDALPAKLKRGLTGLSKNDYDTMVLKQGKLADEEFRERVQQSEAAQAAAATLVFAQQEAGTAVCVSSNGLLLTCAHCVHDSDDEGPGVGQQKWLLLASSQIVNARCVAWDPRRDLALLQIIAASPKPTSHTTSPLTFPFIPIATNPPKIHTSLHCIGHPGSEDLEASTSGIATDYDVLHISSGRYCGLARGQNPQDNSDIGALRHHCWTYWGHSGAPLVERVGEEWRLVGLHSSWDEDTGMRRGVPLVAVRMFVGEWCDGLEG